MALQRGPPGKARKRTYRSGRKFVEQGPNRRKMLNTGREAHFKYDMKAVLADSKMDETKIKAFVQTVFSKGSRVGTPEAKAFVSEKLAEEEVSEGTGRKLLRIIDQYTIYR